MIDNRANYGTSGDIKGISNAERTLANDYADVVNSNKVWNWAEDIPG